MLTQEFLEIVRLAKDHLLEQLPKRPPAPLPKQQPVPTPIAPMPVPKPTIIIKETPKPKEPPPVEKIIPVETSFAIDPILEMIKTHCPKLQLIGEPVETKKTVIILYDQEPENEKNLLENIVAALKKAGHNAHLLPASDLQPPHLQNPSNVLIGSRTTFSTQAHIKVHARRDASGKLFIKESGALAIPSLTDLIEQPTKRRDVWNEILALL